MTVPNMKRWGVAVLNLILCTQAAYAETGGTATVYIAGDSTAANGTQDARGWGRHLSRSFDPARVRVENLARGGRSSRTFVTEGHWDSLVSKLQPGDVVLIQFGHNDGGKINDPRRARGSLPGLGEQTREIENLQTGKHEVVHTFGWYLRKMISETRHRGAVPVLLTLTVRNIWQDGHVERGSGRYGHWARELALSENVPLIDLTQLIADHYEGVGEEAVAQWFPRDHTHTSDEGALVNARLVVQGFKGLREEMWRPWLSAEGRLVLRAAPKYVLIPGVRRGSSEASERRFLNTPYPADPALPTLWLVGDSTVRTGRGRGENGQFGWGDPLENFFDPEKINVVNRAMGGTGARTFRSGGFWQPVLAQLKPGDVVILQFGHNDNGSRGALRGVGPESEQRPKEDGSMETVHTFGAYLREYVDEIRGKKATPIICSLIPRMIWQEEKIQRSNDGHAAWARQVASQQQVRFIDLHELIAQRYDALGPVAVEGMFADRRVHTSYEGAVLNAECVLEGLQQLADNPLREFLISDEAPRPDGATRRQSADSSSSKRR
jgi:lysophospholipase L1-like esterase